MSTGTQPGILIIAIHAMILLTMGILLSNNQADDRPELWVWLVVFVPPMVAILAAIVPQSRRQRFFSYLLAIVLMVPAAGLGIFSGWGLLYIIGIIFLLFAAWQENEGEE